MSDIQQLEQQAIKASQDRAWKQSKDFNQQIISYEPQNIGALNRLAFCHMQLGENGKAKKTYEQVLALEPYNTIATKYSKLLKLKLGFVPPAATTNEDFIEEPGKTKSVSLVRLADTEVLQRTAVATPCELVAKNHRVDVRTIENKIYLGSLPDDVAFRLQKLIKCGNTYSVHVQSTSKKACVIFVKELTRGKLALETPSFPAASSQSPALQEDVLLDEAPLDTRETGNDEVEPESEEPEDTTE